jgi:hypothetical protein
MTCQSCGKQLQPRLSRKAKLSTCVCGQIWFPRRVLDRWLRRGFGGDQSIVPSLQRPRQWGATVVTPRCSACSCCGRVAVIDWTLDGLSLATCGACRSIGLPVTDLERLEQLWQDRSRSQRRANMLQRLRYLVSLFWI